MSTSTEAIRGTELGCQIRCFVQPRASRNQVVGLHGEELKIALTTPPVDGKANRDLCTFLAKTLRVSKGSIELVSGLTSRHKVLEVNGVDVETATKILINY